MLSSFLATKIMESIDAFQALDPRARCFASTACPVVIEAHAGAERPGRNVAGVEHVARVLGIVFIAGHVIVQRVNENRHRIVLGDLSHCVDDLSCSGWAVNVDCLVRDQQVVQILDTVRLAPGGHSLAQAIVALAGHVDHQARLGLVLVPLQASSDVAGHVQSDEGLARA